MLVLLLRHATAEPHGGQPDAARALVEKGWKQAHKAGTFCREHGLVPDLVLSSPLVRARQTAEEFVRACAGGVPEPVVVPWLGLGRASTMLGELAAFRQFATVCLVGHEPDFSMLAAEMLGCPGDGIRVRKASLIGIECPSLRPGAGQLQFSIPNAFLA